MSSYDFLRAALLSRFTKAFGPPHSKQGDGTQWSFPPDIPNPNSPVHIVVTGAGPPAVWVFNPSSAKDGMEYSQVRRPEDIDPLVESIRRRVNLSVTPAPHVQSFPHAPASPGRENSGPPPRAFSKEASP